ncbi:HpcH/HpaI aldolase family protein [Pseudomonas sp. LRF_L74]|uniref:HpcH/HpaI aldolase family protein n=1 Tax=Pseudomonas sp. LRF_L74 TaxID=3369422 RepID=UPI003F61BA99
MTFRERLLAAQPLFSSFIKTPAHQVIEIAGALGMDAVVLDAEHAAFGDVLLDASLLACRAAAVPGLVRVRDSQPSTVLQALDLGAAGLVLPHVCNAEQATELVAMTRYRGGQRGFSNSPRAGEYGGLPLKQHIDLHDRQTAVICQIEDAAALDNLEAIAAVEGVDCLFVGRADLSVSLGTFDIEHADVERVVLRTLNVARAAGKAAGLFISDAASAVRYASAGASFFIVGSDQAALRANWSQQIATFRAGQ